MNLPIVSFKGYESESAGTCGFSMQQLDDYSCIQTGGTETE